MPTKTPAKGRAAAHPNGKADWLTQRYEQVRVGELKPHPKNPRKGDTAAIQASIEANGFYGVVVAQRSTGFVLAGNHRLLAARQVGLETVPVVWGDVYDPFVGSGTTIVAAEGLGRRCWAMEIDPGYCAVVLERMKEMGIEGVRTSNG